jgi:hypothetical protein
MAKHIHGGWYKPGDEIPQPNFVVLGGNLRKNFKPSSPPPKKEGSEKPSLPPKQKDKPQGGQQQDK